MTDDVVSASLGLSATGVASGVDYQLTYSPHAASIPDMTLPLGTTGAFSFTVTNCGNTTGGGILKIGVDASSEYFSLTMTNDGCTGHPGLGELASCTFQQKVSGPVATNPYVEDYVGVSITGQATLSARPTLAVP
jgi:hypothetical protein